MMNYMALKGLQSIEAERASEEEWRRTVLAIAETTLISTTKSVSLRHPFLAGVT